jgi:hypothetical protein
VEAVNKFMEHMKSTMKEACSAIKKSKDNMACYYNHCQTPALEFKPRDKVFLDASDIQTNCPSQKLAHKYLGPFPVIERIGTTCIQALTSPIHVLPSSCIQHGQTARCS